MWDSPAEPETAPLGATTAVAAVGQNAELAHAVAWFVTSTADPDGWDGICCSQFAGALRRTWSHNRGRPTGKSCPLIISTPTNLTSETFIRDSKIVASRYAESSPVALSGCPVFAAQAVSRLRQLCHRPTARKAGREWQCRFGNKAHPRPQADPELRDPGATTVSPPTSRALVRILPPKHHLGVAIVRRAALFPAGSTPGLVCRSVRAVLPTPIRSRKCFHRCAARAPPLHPNGLCR